MHSKSCGNVLLPVCKYFCKWHNRFDTNLQPIVNTEGRNITSAMTKYFLKSIIGDYTTLSKVANS